VGFYVCNALAPARMVKCWANREKASQTLKLVLSLQNTWKEE